MKLIDGRKIRDDILEEVKKEIASLSFRPIFSDILVGGDPVSLQYVNMKRKKAESVGIDFYGANFPLNISTEGLVQEIKKLNKVKNICGIIVQLPLPDSIDRRAVLDAIDSDLDVDCLGTVASEKFYNNKNEIGFPTALACMTLLNSLNLDLKEKKIVVLGQGELVGKPVATLLEFNGLKPQIVNSKGEDEKKTIKEADIIISGIGKGKYITGEMIKKGAILIDAGTSESNNSIVGDVDFESTKEVAGAISPVPGGVGPVTVAMLLKNVLKVAKNKNK